MRKVANVALPIGAKGILPPLKVAGRQHHGKIYYWDVPEIAAQAVTVCKLFKLYSRADWVILSTWFAGYDMPINKVRKTWLNNLEIEVNYLKKQIKCNEEMIDALSRLDRQIQQQKRKPSPFLQSEFFISLVTNTFYNSDFNFEDFECETEIDKLILLIYPTISANKEKDNNLIEVRAISNFLNEHFSLVARYELINNSLDESFEHAHLNWRKAKTVLRWVNRVVSSDASRISKEELQFLLFIGRGFIMMNLILRKLGYGAKFENALNELCVLLQLINVVEIKNKILAQESIADDDLFARLREQIMSIWKNTPMDNS